MLYFQRNYVSLFQLINIFSRLLANPDVSEEPEEELVPPQALGAAASNAESNEDEGK